MVLPPSSVNDLCESSYDARAYLRDQTFPTPDGTLINCYQLDETQFPKAPTAFESDSEKSVNAGPQMIIVSSDGRVHIQGELPSSEQCPGQLSSPSYSQFPGAVYFAQTPGAIWTSSPVCQQQLQVEELSTDRDIAPSDQKITNDSQLPVPSDNERALFLKGCSTAALWNFLIDCLIESNHYGNVCSWTNLWEMRITNTNLFTSHWNAYNPDNSKKEVRYLSVSRALKRFENVKWCGLVLLKSSRCQRNTFRFLPEHNSPMLPVPKECSLASDFSDQPRRSTLLANNYYMLIEIGGKKRVRGKKICEESTLEEKMGIFRTKKQRMEYFHSIASSQMSCPNADSPTTASSDDCKTGVVNGI